MEKTKSFMGRSVALLLTLVMLIGTLPLTALRVFAASNITVTIDTGASVTLKDTDGDGYYDIGTADELYAFAAAVNGGNVSIGGELTANIVVNTSVLKSDGTLNGTPSRTWISIGSSGSRCYIGTFDGNDHTVSGLYVSGSSYYIGLFGYVNRNGNVRNVGVIDSYLAGYQYVAGVVGYNYYGTVTDCYSSATVYSSSYYAGGVIGSNSSGSVSNCYNTGKVSSSSYYAGGVTGRNSSGTIENCYNTGAISNGSSYVGGIVGYNYSGAIKKCYNTGAITGTGSYSDDIGGIVGCNSSGTVTDCYNTGRATGTGSYNSNIGGVAGSNSSGTVKNCYNTGAVTGTGNYIGGVIGDSTGPVSNCYNTGTVSGSRYYVGGVIGSNSSGSVSNCYYLAGCAKDGNGVTQYGMGNSSKGSYTNDVSGRTISKTTSRFSSGEVAYLLQAGVVDTDDEGNVLQIWGQNIDGSGTKHTKPVLGGPKVYYGYTSCTSTSRVYSNTALNETLGHNYSDVVVDFDCAEGGYTTYTCIYCGNSYSNQMPATGHSYTNGFCNGCDSYQPAIWNETDDVYEIGNAGQLYWFAELVNNGTTDADAVLTANIVVNENVLNDDGTVNGTPSHTWTPIGNSTNKYAGTFDGKNHTVSGLYFKYGSTSYLGLFGWLGEGGTVQNAGVIDSYFYCGSYSGGVVGYNYYGTVTNCYSSAVIDGGSDVGGVVGYNYCGTLENCHNEGSVTGSGSYIGGIVGYNSYGTVTVCYNTGKVTGSDLYSTRLGGIVGYNDHGTVTNCYNTASVMGQNLYVGGVAGHNPYGTVRSCYNIGYVNGGYYVGGICGTDALTVSNCYYLDTCGAKGDGTSTTAEQFASGEVAYLLGDAFGQNIDNGETVQTIPVLGGARVYYGYTSCTSATMVYSNTALNETISHSYVDGFCNSCDDCEPAVWNDEDGVYEIGNAGQLYWFAELVNNGTTDADAVLTANIVVNENVLNDDGTVNGTPSHTWTPIGNSTNKYTGTFDGNNHTVSGLYVIGSGYYIGLFGYVNRNGHVRNVGVIDSYLAGYQSVAGVVGENYGTVTDCYSSATVYSSSYYAGGVIGSNSSGSVSNCYNTGSVDGNREVGGVVGSNSGAIENCYNEGSVSGDWRVGGVVGYNGNTVTSCYNTGFVSGNEDVGGVVGYNDAVSYISNCHNTGTVSGNEDVGGVVGSNFGTVKNCYNTGSVSGDSCVGGVAGSVLNYDNDGTVENCYNTGSVSGDYGCGIVGSVDDLNYDYNNEGIIKNCYYLNTCGTSEAGTSKTAEQFASGEVAYLLGDAFGQNIDNGETVQTIPVLGGAKVYCGYISCSATEKTFSNTALNENISHSYSTQVINPSCTGQGYTVYVCTACGDNYTEVIPALGHSYSSKVTEPTCTVDGYTTYTCSVCGDSYTESIPATGHSYNNIVITAPTCSEQGYTTYTCTACGDSYVSDYTEKIYHSYTTVITDPTCIFPGSAVHTCTVCGYSYADIINETGHSYSSEVTEPTCTEQGYTTYTCHCGDSYFWDYTDALGHSYGSVTTEPTCTEEGHTDYTCDACGDSYTETIPATGHNYSPSVTEPTCTQPGLSVYICSGCNGFYTEPIPATGHSYSSVTTDPTCSEDGYTVYTCDSCGHNYNEWIPAKGHTYVGGVCTGCGEKDPNAGGETQLGDLNGDTVIDLLDLSEFAVALANSELPEASVADINGDGIVDLLDYSDLAVSLAG